MTTRITLRYTCVQCFLVDAELEVVARKEEQDIRNWMDYVVRQVGNDHRLRSPSCMADKITHLKIPVYDDVPIGDSQKQ